MKMNLHIPNSFNLRKPNEVTLHARDIKKTGSKKLELFSSPRGKHRAGEEFLLEGHHYIIEKITDSD